MFDPVRKPRQRGTREAGAFMERTQKVAAPGGAGTHAGTADVETLPPPPPLAPAVIAASTQGTALEPKMGPNVRSLQWASVAQRKASGKAPEDAVTEAAFDAIAVARGERAFDHALERTRTLVAQGVQVVWGFDLDNTLYDTRARTLAIGHDFDRAHGTGYFAGTTADDLSHIERDGAATAKAFAMGAEHAEAFAAMWDQEFWNPARVAHDIEIPDVMERARKVLEAGGTLRYVTGRAEHWIDDVTKEPMSFRDDTLARLHKSGLPASDDALVLKPKPGGSTPEFKRGVLVALDALPGVVVAGFVTDTLTELTAMRHVGSIPSFWVRTRFELARHSASPPWVYSLPQVM